LIEVEETLEAEKASETQSLLGGSRKQLALPSVKLKPAEE
jgi:hypothetical protein